MQKQSKLLLALLLIFGVFTLTQSATLVAILLKLNQIETVLSSNGLVSTEDNSDAPGKATSPISVKTADAPYKGNLNAQVVIVEFSDFECPYCKATQPTLRELDKQYGDRILHVFRNYPIASLHPGSVGAAVAALCANDQGKFWEYHDRLFEKATGSGSLTNAVIRTIASELELNSTEFNSCFNSKKYLERVQKDFEDGTQYTVSGTPTFFINNRIVSGNLPVEVFKKVIDEELNKSH
jgi:protein-disulfide isomerase